MEVMVDNGMELTTLGVVEVLNHQQVDKAEMAVVVTDIKAQLLQFHLQQEHKTLAVAVVVEAETQMEHKEEVELLEYAINTKTYNNGFTH